MTPVRNDELSGRTEECQGLLLYVMGPSGSGKDSLISHARKVMGGQTCNGRRVRFARRYITREAESVGEDHYPVSREGFLALKKAGEFCMDWQSHGLYYGVSYQLVSWLEHGEFVVVNGSREYLPVAEERFDCLIPLLITVKPQVLQARLRKRGRESSAGIRERLERAALPVQSRAAVIRLDNSGSLYTAQAEFIRILSSLPGTAAQIGRQRGGECRMAPVDRVGPDPGQNFKPELF